MAYPAPNGRELAIEALLDREPHGDAYRVSRVLEEVVPMALHNRPNRVTTAALVEEAFGATPRPTTDRPSLRKLIATNARLPLILDYQERIVQERQELDNQVAAASATETHHPLAEPWLEWMQKIWSSADKKSSSAAPGIKVLQERLSRNDAHNVAAEDVTESSEVGEKEASSERNVVDWTMEEFLSRLLVPNSSAQDEEKGNAERVAAVWLAITLLMANETCDPVQCGHLLSTLQFERDASDAYELDPQILSYLGDAAAVCQERWIAQKPAPAETQELVASSSVAASAEEDVAPASPVVVTQTVSTPTSIEGVPAAPAVEDSIEEIQQDEPEPHEQPTGANVINPDSSDSSSESESSDSESSSSESSSEEEVRRAELFVESERSVDDETDDDNGLPALLNRDGANADEDGEDTDDYDTLRQALALAVNEESNSTAMRVIVNQPNDDTEEEPLAETPVSDGPTDGTEDFFDDDEEEADEEENEEAEVELPALPTPPSQPAFQNPLSGYQADNEEDGTEEQDEIDWQAVYDPTNAKQFAAIPRDFIVVHLMRYAEALLASLSPSQSDDEKEEVSLPPVPGGMGSFLYNVGSVWDGEPVGGATSLLTNDRESIELIFQLAATTLVTLCHRRSKSLQQLRQTIEKERRAMQGEVLATDDRHPTGEEKEEDDPATAFAMSHVEDADAPLSIEVLENKGMRRKAAAAAHDAARLLRIVRKEKEDLKASLAFDSTSILTVLKTSQTPPFEFS